jgi:hypothetical protein
MDPKAVSPCSTELLMLYTNEISGPRGNVKILMKRGLALLVYFGGFESFGEVMGVFFFAS